MKKIAIFLLFLISVFIGGDIAAIARSGGAGPQPAPGLLPGTVNDCVKYVTPTQGGTAGAPCAGTPVVFVGTTGGSANAQTIASPTPSGFTFTDGYVVVAKIGASLTNTAAATLNASATGAKAVAVQDTSGALSALTGGEIPAGATLIFTAHTSCPAPISADCYVMMTTPGSPAPITAGPATITVGQWGAWQVVNCTANCTITLPAANTLATTGGLVIINVGSVVTTLTPAASDGFNGQTINTSATITGNLTTVLTTSGSTGVNAFRVPRGLVQGSNVTITHDSSGTETIAATGGGSSAPSIPQGRVTPQTGKPLMDADVVAATTLYYDSFEGNQAPVWNGSSMVGLTITADEISMGLSATNQPANSFHSLFLVNNASALALCTVRWTNGTTPGPAAVSLKNGVWTISAAPTNCWGGVAGATDLASAIPNPNQATLVGCVATTGTNGQTAMQFAPSAAAGGPNTWRGITNVYNTRTKGSEAFDSTASWTIAGSTFAPLNSAAGNGGLGNRVSYFDCLGQLTADTVLTVDNIPATSQYDIYSVCLDSASAGCPGRNIITQSPGANYRTTLTGKWFFGPSRGFHFVQAMEEYFGAAGTTEGGGATGLLVTLPY